MSVPAEPDHTVNQKCSTTDTNDTAAVCAIIGVGNELAGDDGAGIVAVSLLESMLQQPLRSN